MRRRILSAVELVRSPLRLQELNLEQKLRRAGLRRRRVELPNGSVRAWIGPPGPPLLLVMGFGGDARWQWHQQVPALARRFRLIVPDLLFFGGSRSELPERSLGLQTETLLQLMDAHGIRRFDMAGISYGGLIAYDLASRFPERVRRLVIISSPGPAMTERDHDALLSRFGVRHIAELMVPTGPDEVRRLIHAAWHRPPRVPRFALRDAWRVMFREGAQDQRALLSDLLTTLAGRPDLAPLPHDTLLVWGEQDRIFPLDLAHRLQASIGSHARLHVIPAAGHAPHLERAREFNRVLLDFLGR